jgi:hypothetical protein
MISDDVIEVGLTYGRRYKFFLKMIFIEEEQKLREKAFGLKEEERAEKEYPLNVGLLSDLSVQHTEGIDAEDGETPSAAVKRFFAEKTPRKERIAFFAVRGYFLRLQPEDFS